MLVSPRVSEKSYKLNADNVYVFDVPLSSNKAEIISAIEEQYDGVKIKDVRTLIVKGKVKAVNRGKRSRPGQASRKDIKKAYVSVLEGKIDIAAFKEVENQAKEAAKSEKKQVKKDDIEANKSTTVTKRRTGRRGDR